MFIDLSQHKLSDEFITNPVFLSRIEALANTYVFGDLPYYNTWFKHNIPYDIYFSSESTLKKIEKYGLPYFSMTEDPTGDWYKTPAGQKYIDSVLHDKQDRLDMIRSASDKYSPYWYALKATCHVSIVISNMIARELFPDVTWYNITTGGHALVADRPASHITCLKDFQDCKVIDILTSSFTDAEQSVLLLSDNFQKWRTLEDNDALWERLCKEEMIITL